MTDPARDREDEVIESFLEHLTTEAHRVEVIERPDRIPEAQRRLPSVTTDALIGVQTDRGETDLWAVDVTALAQSPTWPAALTALDERFTELACKHQIAISVEGTLPPAQDAAGLVAVCSRAIGTQGTTGTVTLAEDLTATWEPGLGLCDEERVVVTVLMPTSSPLLSDQVADTLRPTLTKKAARQGRRAQASGARYIVLLDSTGDDSIAQGTHWLPQFPQTIQDAVNDVLGDLDRAPDVIYLWDREGQWHLMKGFDR